MQFSNSKGNQQPEMDKKKGKNNRKGGNNKNKKENQNNDKNNDNANGVKKIKQKVKFPCNLCTRSPYPFVSSN